MLTDAQVIAQLTDREKLALTMWAEARDQKVEGRIAVGCAVRNRRPHFTEFRASDSTFGAICLAPNQFSCWEAAGGAQNNRDLMVMATRVVEGQPSHDPIFDECLALADGLMSGALTDRTNGATYYWAPAAMIPPGTVPAFAEGKTWLGIGGQNFV